ncbi:MAG: nuclear transport factor 2 family protein [Spirochaetaceae bacterium]|nr:nuclear transport factor 2 family protein [Spirochaetaceae bacterium]HPG27214.1 nuclear transport factor 2 family protein [Myxococcota bacterium]
MSSIAQDVLDIQTLKARYADAVDGGWTGTKPHDADAVLALFVEDGVWDGGEFGGGQGHAGIREYMLTGEAIMPFAFHHISNPRIEIEGDTARARWHALLAVDAAGQAQLHVGIYDDEMVRTPEGWKFRRLGFTLAASTDLPAPWKCF